MMQSPRKLVPIGSGRPPSASNAPPVALNDSDYESSSSSSSSSSGGANHSGESEADDAGEGVVGAKSTPRDAVPRPSSAAGRPVSAGGNQPNGRPTSAGTVQGGMLAGGDSSSSDEEESTADEREAEVSHSQQRQQAGGRAVEAAHRQEPEQDFPVEFAPSPKVTSTPSPRQQVESNSAVTSNRNSARASLNRVDSEFEYGAPTVIERKPSALGESGGFPASAAHITDAPFNSPARATDPIEVIAADRARSDAERKRLTIAGAARQISLERRSSRSRGNSKNPSQASTPIPSPRGSITGPLPLMPSNRSPQPRMAVSSSPHLSPSTATNFAAFSLAAPTPVATSAVAAAPVSSAIVAAAAPAAAAAAAAAAVPYVSNPSSPPPSAAAAVVVVPPLLSVFLPGLPSMCEVCDERQARVFCLECNQKQCWGLKSSSGSAQGGCCIDVHRHPKRTTHQRWEWTIKGRGRRIEFDPDVVAAAVTGAAPEVTQAAKQQPAPIHPAAASAFGLSSASPVAAAASAASPSSSSGGFARSVSIPSTSAAAAAAYSSYSSPTAATPAAAASSSPSSLHPSNWLPSHVCAWLLGVLSSSAAVDVCLPAFQRLSVSGSMLLRMSDETLRSELGVTDSQTRRTILAAVESLQRLAAAPSSSSSSSASASVLHSADPSPSLDLAALMSSQGLFPPAAAATTADPAESLTSASVSYSRAQLVFVLGERERLIARLQDENRSLQRRLERR